MVTFAYVGGARFATCHRDRLPIATMWRRRSLEVLSPKMESGVIDETAARPALGPDVVPAGPPLTVHSGHCWFLGGETGGVDGVRRLVREHADRGVDVIKVMVTGGRMTAGTQLDACQFTLDELRAAADEAHRLGLPITGHAHGRAGIVAAMDAGFDCVEHATFLTSRTAGPSGVQPVGRRGNRAAACSGFVVLRGRQ